MDYNAPSFSTDPDADYSGKSGSTVGSAIPPKVPTLLQREIVNAEKAGGLTPSNDDRTQLAQSIGRGLWLGTLGANANALVGALGAGAGGTKPAILQTLNAWTKLRGIALQTNTSVDVTITVSGIGTASGVVTAPLRKRDGVTKPAVGDVPTLWPFEVQWDGAYFRFVGTVASDLGSFSGLRLHREFLDAAGSNTWNPPQGLIGLVCADLWGAGGGGAGTNGSGGGAGEWAYTEFAATYGTPVPYINGLPGAGVTSGNANNGGTTSIAGCTALGGNGGGSSNANPGVGGSGGTGGLKRRAGGAGQDLDGNETYAAGGTAAKMPGPHYGLSGSNTAEGGYATSSGAAVGALGSNGGPAGIELAYLVLAA